MDYSAKNLIKILRQKGWILDRVKGSHHVFQHPNGGFVIVPVHGNKDLAKGTFFSILKDAGIDKSEI
ncbi:type II toxin-antitoxin system HicA family toxin [Runella sp.]|jgi:predicted RNA binding protein YcfA (HicA-like mRNA interferase family)|uniref:type II toxin-antitoxin system HicA family toxin n=1 Tax=Runella sp. TaxID=1960881 RepID=UPI0026173EBF|nr:type II toxin-antitoxin system HicA family toxin [Runella sp.]